MSKKFVILYATGIILLLLVGYFVYPTLYRYDKLGQQPVRINRITGVAERLGLNGWTTLASSKQVSGKPASADDLSKVKANLEYKYDSFVKTRNLKGNVYNGSDKDLQSLTVEISVKNSDGSLDSRKYRLNTAMGPVYSLKSSEMHSEIDIDLAGKSWSYKIVDAEFE